MGPKFHEKMLHTQGHYVTVTLENGVTVEVLEPKPGGGLDRLTLIYNSDKGGNFEIESHEYIKSFSLRNALAEFFTPGSRAFEKRFERIKETQLSYEEEDLARYPKEYVPYEDRHFTAVCTIP
ncbi:hypothetical protein PHJA_000234500 [Phtheirospermum japonicum]|uniref:Uncharacterized protein n=1 Tax=Phtheirospermum japonicum TaxID=374723 RepID=A0A830B5F6_9LAMI|nr:hypothetical protein PHJA_000234500 [Phtheirospermum japonicum]